MLRLEFSPFFRYVGSAVIVTFAALLRAAMAPSLSGYPILLFIPAVFLSALLFGRAAGFFATGVATGMAVTFFMGPVRIENIASHFLPLSLFVLICFAVSVVLDELKSTMIRLETAEQAKSMLFDELAHRTKNDFAIISSAITLQSNAARDPRVKQALTEANARVLIVASAHERLHAMDAGGSVELAGYVEGLCGGLAGLLRGIRPIALRVACDSAEVPSSTAVTVGLIVNELITNCFKYAFPEEGEGQIDVHIAVEGRRILIAVEDNGIGCPIDAKNGLGSRLVRLLAQQKKGSFRRESGPQGCRAIADLAETSIPE